MRVPGGIRPRCSAERWAPTTASSRRRTFELALGPVAGAMEQQDRGAGGGLAPPLPAPRRPRAVGGGLRGPHNVSQAAALIQGGLGGDAAWSGAAALAAAGGVGVGQDAAGARHRRHGVQDGDGVLDALACGRGGGGEPACNQHKNQLCVQLLRATQLALPAARFPHPQRPHLACPRGRPGNA